MQISAILVGSPAQLASNADEHGRDRLTMRKWINFWGELVVTRIKSGAGFRPNMRLGGACSGRRTGGHFAGTCGRLGRSADEGSTHVWISRSSPTRDQGARVPHGIRIYAIGDIHGRADLLDQVFGRIDADLAGAPVRRAIHVLLGDYIDRGPSSREVLDRLIARGHTHETVFLKGNHETFVADFLANPALLEEWRRYGGLETLMSYGLAPSMKGGAAEQASLAAAFERALPAAHREFLATLNPYFLCGDFFFVHAGVRPRVPLAQQAEHDLLWIREDFLLHEENFEKIVVHGHTPVAQPDVRPNRINIDTGAYATGQLTCLTIEGDELLFI